MDSVQPQLHLNGPYLVKPPNHFKKKTCEKSPQPLTTSNKIYWVVSDNLSLGHGWVSQFIFWELFLEWKYSFGSINGLDTKASSIDCSFLMLVKVNVYFSTGKIKKNQESELLHWQNCKNESVLLHWQKWKKLKWTCTSPLAEQKKWMPKLKKKGDVNVYFLTATAWKWKWLCIFLRVAKCQGYGRYVSVKILETWGKSFLSKKKWLNMA